MHRKCSIAFSIFAVDQGLGIQILHIQCPQKLSVTVAFLQKHSSQRLPETRIGSQM